MTAGAACCRRRTRRACLHTAVLMLIVVSYKADTFSSVTGSAVAGLHLLPADGLLKLDREIVADTDHSSSRSTITRNHCSTSSRILFDAGNTDIVTDASSISSSTDYRQLRFSVLSLLLPWLYFMSTSINIPALPKLVNHVINSGNNKVSESSATVYGNIQGIDALFTFLSVNLIGCLSDVFGRRPFMFLSSLGLGTAYTLYSMAQTPHHFYIAACIDGLTSCMLSQSQAYVMDHQVDRSNLSKELSKFQGIAIGCAFMIGIPLGGVLIQHSIRTPIRVAICLCMCNCIFIPIFLPRAPSFSIQSASSPNATTSIHPTSTGLRRINWRTANPLGAAVMLSGSKKLLIASVAYFLLNLSQCGLQSTWINYLDYRFGWSAEVSGATLMIVGVIVAVIPPIVIPLIGVVNSFKYALLLHGLSLVYLATVTSSLAVFIGMPFLAAGASGMPILLGYLTEQVPRDQVGALQGAADTVRTVASMIGSLLVTRIFAHFISCGRNFPHGALYFSAIFSLLGFMLVATI